MTGGAVADGSLSGDDLLNGSVTGGDLADGSVNGAEVADGTLGGADLADGSVTGADVSDGFVGGADVNDGTIGSADLADESVVGTDVQDGALGHSELTSGVVGIVRGYAWIDNSATPIGVPTIVNNGYQFNDGLGAVTVNRSATGTYTVAFAGLNIGTGHVQVTGAGGSAVWCKVQNWASSAAIVLCFNSAGAATDSTFNIAMIE